MSKFLKFLKAVGVAVLGGAVVGATQVLQSGGPVTGKTVGVAAAAGAVTAVAHALDSSTK